MTYFETLPTIIYEFSTGERSVIDIFSRVAMKPSFFANTSFYTTEQLETVLRPDQLSYEKYGEFKYYWLLLLVNKIYDIHRDWPVQQEVFGTALEKLQNKKVYYIYQNVEIVPNDILYFSDTSYGVIESWNPFYKEIVIKEGYGVLPTSDFTTAEIRRVTSASTGKFIKLTNYCDSSDPLITTTAIDIIGYSPFLEAPAQFIDGSNRAVNPFIGATGGTIQVPNIIIMDTCSEEDRTLFQSTILSRIINDLNVTGIKVKTKEDVFISEYYNKIKLNIINSEIVPIILNKANILITDTPETATTLVRID
jgi:hypothetical protein